jgi:dynein heavy chain
MAVKLSEDIDMQEYDFFLRGELRKSADSHSSGSHPDWINNWDMIVEMQKQLPNFANIEGSFTHNGPEWKRWYASSTPETDNLPLEWESKCDKLRKMILLKVIRPDRVLPAVNQFVCD